MAVAVLNITTMAARRPRPKTSDRKRSGSSTTSFATSGLVIPPYRPLDPQERSDSSPTVESREDKAKRLAARGHEKKSRELLRQSEDGLHKAILTRTQQPVPDRKHRVLDKATEILKSDTENFNRLNDQIQKLEESNHNLAENAIILQAERTRLEQQYYYTVNERAQQERFLSQQQQSTMWHYTNDVQVNRHYPTYQGHDAPLPQAPSGGSASGWRLPN